MEKWELVKRVYDRFSEWRVDLYQAIAVHALTYDGLHVLAGDLRQVLERVETEMLFKENQEKDERDQSAR